MKNKKFLKQQIEKLQEQLRETEKQLEMTKDLLLRAHDLMDNTHCYDTDIYHDIGFYFDDCFDLVGQGSEGLKEKYRRMEEE